MDENLIDFEEQFVPLLRAAKERGLSYRVEQCPMPGWTIRDNWHNNIGYTPAAWIALHRICERHGVGDQFRIHYDPSHAILMGQDTRSVFQYLKEEGYAFLIGGFHVKGQVIDARGVAAWGYGGQTMQRGDWVNGKPSSNPADQLNAWKKQVVLAEHELPGTARHDPLAYLQNRTVDWFDHQLAARELLPIEVAKTNLVVEHEYPKARIQDRERLKPILQGSVVIRPAHRRCRGGDVRAAARSAGSQRIPIPGCGPGSVSVLTSPALPQQFGDELSDSSRLSAGDSPEGGRAGRLIRRVEIDLVERVEELTTNLKAQALTPRKHEVPHHRDIGLGLRRSADDVLPESP